MTFDRNFWEEQGYFVLHDAVTPEERQATLDAISAFTNKDLADRNDWYKEPMLGGGMVNMAHDQALWNNRQSPRIYETFKEIWGTGELWVTINRANMNLPVTESYTREGFIHWDMNVAEYSSIRPAIQAVLYLTYTGLDQGGFQCVPQSHRRLEEWRQTHAADQHPTEAEIMDGLEIKKIEGQAGDLVLWPQTLLHGNGQNVSPRPRFAQYICMTPAGTARTVHGIVEGGEELRQARVDTWRWGPYQRALAEDIGVCEGMAERWLTAILDSEDAVCNVPTPQKRARLSDEQLAQLPDRLSKRGPWVSEEVTHAQQLSKKYGTTVSYLSRAILARDIAEAIADEFGIEHTAQPAQLSDLGKRLLGLEKW